MLSKPHHMTWSTKIVDYFAVANNLKMRSQMFEMNSIAQAGSSKAWPILTPTREGQLTPKLHDPSQQHATWHTHFIKLAAIWWFENSVDASI